MKETNNSVLLGNTNPNDTNSIFNTTTYIYPEQSQRPKPKPIDTPIPDAIAFMIGMVIGHVACRVYYLFKNKHK